MNKKYFLLFWLVASQVTVIFSFPLVYTRPQHDIKKHLLQLIDQEKKSICAAVYMLTDKAIAQSLVDAYVRGVSVNLVVDQISNHEIYGKVRFLEKNGIKAFVFEPAQKDKKKMFQPIMHHKFFVFEHNKEYKKGLVWTGSFNCTASASKLHHENAIVLDDKSVIKEYKSCFNDLVRSISEK